MEERCRVLSCYVGSSPSFVNLLKLSKDNLYLHLLMQEDLKINLNYIPELFSTWAVIRGDYKLLSLGI